MGEPTTSGTLKQVLDKHGLLLSQRSGGWGPPAGKADEIPSWS